MNIKKVVAVALILSSMTAVSASAAEFNDIKGHWAEEVINELADKDIIHGVSDTEFKSGRNCNACRVFEDGFGYSRYCRCAVQERRMS